MYLDDKDIDDLFSGMKDDAVTPPDGVKGDIMNSLGEEAVIADAELDKMFADLSNDAVVPPSIVKDNVMGAISGGFNWRVAIIAVLLIGLGTTGILIFNWDDRNGDPVSVEGGARVESMEQESVMNQGSYADDITADDHSSSSNDKRLPIATGKSTEQESNLGTGSIADKEKVADSSSNSEDQHSKDSKPYSNNESDEVFYSTGTKTNFNNSSSTFNQPRKDKTEIDSKTGSPDITQNNNKSFNTKSENTASNVTGSDQNNPENSTTENTDLSSNVSENISVENAELVKINPINFDGFGADMANGLRLDLRNLGRPQRLKFGLEAQFGYTYSNPLGKLEFDNLNENGTIRNIQSMQVGVNAVMNYRSILFKLGVAYDFSSSKFDYRENTQVNRTTVVYEEVMDSSGQTTQNIVATFNNTSLETYQFRVRNKSQYFSIPVQIGYQFDLSSRWFMEVLGGARFSFLTKTEAYYQIETSDNIQRVDLGSDLYRKFLISATVDLGVGFRLTENLNLGIYAPFRIGLNSRLKNYSKLNYEIGGIINFRYSF